MGSGSFRRSPPPNPQGTLASTIALNTHLLFQAPAFSAIRTQREQIDASMQQEQLIAVLTASFCMLALVLACVGVYGVMAYSVVQRTSEIGIRMAQGAMPRQVLTMVLREGTWISAAGIACGIGASTFAARLVQSLLYGLKTNDLVVFAGTELLLIAGGTRGKLDSGSSCRCGGTNAGSSTGVSFGFAI